MTEWCLNAEAPLNRIKWESKNANIALRDYYRMGPGRSLAKLHAKYLQEESIEPPTRKRYTIDTWCLKNHWVKRVAAKQALDDAEEERLWAARRRQVREQDWEMADKLRGVAAKILEEAPIFVKQQRRFIKGEEGQPDREVITMALNGQLGVKAAEAGSKLARLAAEMENERQKIVLAMEREVEAFFDAAQQVLDESDFNRLLSRLGGETGGETAAEEESPEQTEEAE